MSCPVCNEPYFDVSGLYVSQVFCEKCGTQLFHKHNKCTEWLSVEARFCGVCGTANPNYQPNLFKQRAEAEERRKEYADRKRFENLESLVDIRLAFEKELEKMVSFEEKGDYVLIKPKIFLGQENFRKIASTVRKMGGEYVSAGSDSHFRVPKKKN